MAGEGMVAVVRGLRDAGLAVTLLDGNRQYTLLPNSTTAPASTQHSTPTNANASTQPIQRVTTESSTESSALHCDKDAQAVDGRYTTMYKTMHCNVRPTSPTVQLTEFPPQKPDHCPGHGNFQVGGAGSGAVSPRLKQTSPATSFRGGLSWPDRGCVCSPRPSIEVDAFANSLRKYPCLSPEKSSEVMERLINYQVRGLSRTSTRNHASPTRASDSYPSSNHTLESKGTYTKGARLYEPEVTVRRKMEEPTRERKREDSYDARNYEVRCLRDLARKGKESVSSHFGTQPYCNPACPTIKETLNYQAIPEEYHNSSNSVNMEIQAAVKMISKEVATTQREKFPRKTVAVPDSPTLSAAEDNAEGECYLVRNLNTSMSIKSIQTSFLPHDSTLKPRKSAQTIASTVDFQSSRHKTVVNRRSKSQEQIKTTKEELKKNLLELIEEVSKTSQRKKIIRDELIKKLFESNENERVIKEDRHYKKREQCHKYASTFCPTVCDYVGDYQELLGQLKHCYGDAQQVLQSEVTPFRISEYQQLDFVLKDWINNLDIKTVNQDSLGRRELLNDLEDKIKVVFKNRTKQDFDLKSAIVNVIQEIPIEVNNSYNRADYLHKLVDALIKRMKNVIVGQHYERYRKKPYNKFNKVFTEADIRSFIREHLFDFFNEYSLRTYAHVLVALENELVDVIINAIDCIRCGHIEDARDEMNIIFQELANLTENQAKYVASVMLRDLQQVLNHCNFNHTYMILNMNNNSGPSNRGHFNENIERLNSDDFRENLDRYANQLCQQINQWLDSLNIPQIQDTGIREVVVNDLAADIIDRLKYLELNQINTADEDELEALKYQIFKWINKLVGDDNQETINNARLLLDKIRSVPIPLLIHPRAPQYTLVECPNPECYQDPMRPCLGEFGPGTCSEINRKLRPPTPCCTRAGEEVPCPAEQCCIRETCPEILESQGLVKSQNKSYSANQDYYRRSPKPQTQSQPLQQPQSSSSGYQSSQDQSSASDKYYTVPDSLQSQEKQLPHSQDQSFGLDPQQPRTFPSSYQSPQSPASVQDKYFVSPSSPQNQVTQLPYNQDQSFSLGQQQPQTFPSSYQSPQSQASAKDKYSASPDNQKIREKTPAYNRDKSFGLGQTYGPSNKKWTSNASGKSNAHGPMQLKRPTVNEDIQQSMFDVGGPSGITNSPQGAQTSISIVPGPARPTPHPSIKKILADYDAYLKEWVKKVSIPMNTPSEKQAADKARLDLYNGVYKTITKMKLDPKIFGNPLYFKELFNEEIEKLIKNLPKSKQLEIEKPALSAELLKKTLEMNNLIRSLNVSSTYKQHVIDCVENNSPRAPPLANETDQQNEEIEKHNVADYYILHRRYKDEDNVKANFHKKNFLKSLDDYLENIKKRHDLIGIETYGYANEIINCLDKIPIPNLLALRDEADETLLGMEVENWIADLPQYLDTTGPLDKRRIRDAVVKKIQEVEANVNCNENAFGDHLKAELPKYIERIPIKEDINVNFVIDELVNRIRNLENMKSRPRYVSFQEPKDYEDFVRDVPRASSFHETPGQSNSYYLGGINNADDPRSWVPRNVSSPLDDQWQSMQATRAPADLRDWSQTTQSEPFAYTQNGPSQMVTTPSHSLNDYGSPRHLPSVSPAQFPLGQEYYNSNAQSTIPPLHHPNAQNGHHPNALKQVDPNNPGDVCTGPCCLNPTCVSKVQGYVNPTQYSQPSTSPLISSGGYIPRMVGQRGVPPGVAVSSPSPQPYGQVNLNPYSCNSNYSDGRCRGPITRYYQEQYQHPVTPLRGNQMHSRGMPVPPTRAPQAPYGQSQLIPQNLQEPIETQRPTYFLGSYIDPLLQSSPYQQPIEAVSRPSIPQPQVPQVQGVPANIFSSRQVPYMPTSEQIPQFAYAQDVPNDTTTPYQAPIGSLFTFPDQGPQHLPDISAPQFKRYTQGTSVAPQERRPLVPHFSKGPIGPISMKTFVKPSLSSQGRFSLGHYGQSNSNDPNNIIPDSRRTSQISAVNPKERHFSESSKKSVSNSQYLAPEVEMGSSKKPVDLQERDHTEPYIQNVPNKYAETAPDVRKLSETTAVSPHESYYLEPQSEPVIKRTSKVLDHRSKILESQSKVPAASLQVTQYSDRQKQFVPNASDSQSEFKIDSKEQAVPQEIRKSKPDEQTYANDQDKIVPSNQSDSMPPVIPFDRPSLSPRQQSIKSGRDISTQVSLRDTEASPQDVTSEQKPWRLSTKVSPKIQYDPHPSDQTYSELPTVVLEGPGPQDLHELKPPSASSAPVSTIPSLDHGSQPPNKQGNSVLSSFKSGGQNKIQSEPIPSAFKDRQPNLTTIGDTEVSHERPGGTSADISEVIPYDQMAPKGYSSPTNKTFEPAFQMDPSSPLQTGDVIPDSQISPENVKTQPQTNDITPETQLIQDNQGSQLHSKHPIRSNQIPFNDLQNLQSDFVPFSQAIEIEIWSPIHVEQYPPTVTYEYIPDSISFEKTHFSIQTAKTPALVSAASQAPEEILEVHLPGVVRDGRMYGTGKEPGPCAPESIEAVRKKKGKDDHPSFHKSTDSKGIRKTIEYHKRLKQPEPVCDCDSVPMQTVRRSTPQNCTCTDPPQQRQDSPPFLTCTSGPEGEMCLGSPQQRICPGAFQHRTCQTGPSYHICSGTSIEHVCRSGGLRRMLKQQKKPLKKNRPTRHTVDAVPFFRVIDYDDTDTSMDMCKCIKRAKICRARKQNQDFQASFRPCPSTIRYRPRRY